MKCFQRTSHLYEFYIANSQRSREKTRFDDENEKVFNMTVATLYPLQKHKKIFYFFDHGDSWLFRISKTMSRPKKP